MRILITGSREWTDRHVMVEAFEGVKREISDAQFFLAGAGRDGPEEGLTIIHGDARGADRLAAWVGVAVLGPLFPEAHAEVHPADWDKHGKRAGPIRNQEMVDTGADFCMAFFVNGASNRGTSDCVRRAEEAGIEVRKFYSDLRREPMVGV